MPKSNRAGAGTAGLATPISVEGVFDAPGVICRLVQRNGPYLTMASYLPAAAVRAAGPQAWGSRARHARIGRGEAPWDGTENRPRPAADRR